MSHRYLIRGLSLLMLVGLQLNTIGCNQSGSSISQSSVAGNDTLDKSQQSYRSRSDREPNCADENHQ